MKKIMKISLVILPLIIFSIFWLNITNVSAAKEIKTKIDSSLVSNYSELKDAIENAPNDGSETVIVVTADFSIDAKRTTINSGQNIKIIDDGIAHKINIETSNDYIVFDVKVGGILTIATSNNDNSQLIFNGEKLLDNESTFVSNRGTLNWLGGTLENYQSYQVRVGTIHNQGPNSKMYLKEGLFQNNKGGYGSGMIMVVGGATFIMDGGTITNNDFYYDATASAVYVSSFYYFDESITTPSTFTMNGGIISNNTSSSGGGIFVGNDRNEAEDRSTNGLVAKVIINDGLITGNKSVVKGINDKGSGAGGGIFVSMAGSVTLNGGTISNNIAQTMGGGVATYDYWSGYYEDAYIKAGYNDKELAAVWAKWPDKYPAEFIMNNGVIKGNEAPTSEEFETGITYGAGGGIYIASNKVKLNAGEIYANMASSQGGGVYVSHVPYVAYMSNVLVTNNKASILGGGIWMCPTGDTKTFLSSGIAFFDNNALGAGNDLASIKKSANWSLTIAQRMLGGGYENWYYDGDIIDSDTNQLGEPNLNAPRFPNTEPFTNPIINSNSYLALAANPTINAKKAAQSSAKLLIYDNEAKYGAGIGSNGALIAGPDTPYEDEEVEVSVEKIWEDDNNNANKRPDSIKVNLIRDTHIIQEIELHKENNWKYTFENLPKYQDVNVSELSIYEIEEVSVPYYSTEYIKEVDTNGNIVFIIKNIIDEQEPEEPDPEKPKPVEPTKPIPETGSSLLVIALVLTIISSVGVLSSSILLKNK